MPSVAVTNTFISGTTAVAADVNTNFTDITTYINNRNSGTTAWDTVKGTTLTSAGTAGNTLVIDTTTLVVDASNNRVGIGTASPSNIFDVKGLDSENYLWFNGNAGSDGRVFQMAGKAATSFVMADHVMTNQGSGNDSGAGRFLAYNTVAGGGGNSSVRAIEAHVVTNTGTTTFSKWGIEVGVHNDVADADANGIYNASSHTGWGVTGTRNNTAYWALGEDGWKYGFKLTDTDGSTRLFSVGGGGSAPGESKGEIRSGDGTVVGQLKPDASNSRLRFGTTSNHPIHFVANDSDTNVMVLSATGRLTTNSAAADEGIIMNGSNAGGPWLYCNATNGTAANRFTGVLLQSNGTTQWGVELRTGDGNLHIRDRANSKDKLLITAGGSVSIGDSADTSVVNLRINGNSRTGANTGTLTNCPHNGNPTTYIDVSINGTTYCIPCFATS